MKITLHKNQGAVFQSTSRFKVLAAGRRFGKTILACVILFVECLKTKEGLFWYVSPTYRQTKQIAWKILVKLIPEAVLSKRPNETELSFHFKNGTILVLKGADNPDSLRGSGLDGLVVDEFASIRYAKNVWEEVLRPSLTDKLGWCLFIGTPKGKNAFWELFEKGQRKADGYESWQFGTKDNPFIPRSEIKEAEQQLSPRFFRQEYEASFEDFVGMVWPEFNDDCVVRPFEIQGPVERVGSIDPAITGTFASLFGKVTPDGTIYIVGEYYEQDKRISEVSGKIRNMADKWYCDPAGQRKTQTKNGQLYSIFDEFRDNNILVWPANNDVNSGINRVAEKFLQGKIKIFDTCVNLLKEIERYHWAEKMEGTSGESEPKPYKAFDHACDCLRYLVASRPQEPKPKETKPWDHLPLKDANRWDNLQKDVERKTETAIDQDFLQNL